MGKTAGPGWNGFGSYGSHPPGLRGKSLSARLCTVLVVGVAHGLVLWMFWRVHAPVVPEVEGVTSVLFFFSQPYQARAQPSTRPTPQLRSYVRAPAAVAATATAAAAPAESSAAITVAAPAVDWSAQLASAARSTLANETKGREQRGALLRRFRSEDDPRETHADPRRGFRWYDAGSHRFDTRGALPAWHLSERCVLVAFIFAACALGHIELHGDLFDGAAARHGETLATHGPNDAP